MCIYYRCDSCDLYDRDVQGKFGEKKFVCMLMMFLLSYKALNYLCAIYRLQLDIYLLYNAKQPVVIFNLLSYHDV